MAFAKKNVENFATSSFLECAEWLINLHSLRYLYKSFSQNFVVFLLSCALSLSHSFSMYFELIQFTSIFSICLFSVKKNNLYSLLLTYLSTWLLLMPRNLAHKVNTSHGSWAFSILEYFIFAKIATSYSIWHTTNIRNNWTTDKRME